MARSRVRCATLDRGLLRVRFDSNAGAEGEA
jgi:hypothetical protein